MPWRPWISKAQSRPPHGSRRSDDCILRFPAKLTFNISANSPACSRASYYRRFEVHAPREADAELTSHIQLLSLRHRFYGYRRIHSRAQAFSLIVNAKRVQRLMRTEDNLIAMRRKCLLRHPLRTAVMAFSSCRNLLRGAKIAFRAGSDLGGGHHPHLLARGLLLIFAVILDGFSRKVRVGLGFSSPSRCLACRASAGSRACRSQAQARQSHSSFRSRRAVCLDRLSPASRQPRYHRQHGSRPGNPYDNAKAESFMKTLKTEAGRWPPLQGYRSGKALHSRLPPSIPSTIPSAFTPPSATARHSNPKPNPLR